MLQVYYYCSMMNDQIEGLSSPRFTPEIKAEVQGLFRQRWDEFNSPLHCAAFALDPEFQDCHFNPEVMRGLRAVCLRMLGNTDAAKAALLGHAAYAAHEGDFGDPLVLAMKEEMAPYQWWQQAGGECRELQTVAVRVLAMVSSAGACERVWSTFDFVHSKKRNRLDPDRAGDLVYVHRNRRLHKRAKKSEPFAEWYRGEELTQEEREEV